MSIDDKVDICLWKKVSIGEYNSQGLKTIFRYLQTDYPVIDCYGCEGKDNLCYLYLKDDIIQK